MSTLIEKLKYAREAVNNQSTHPYDRMEIFLAIEEAITALSQPRLPDGWTVQPGGIEGEDFRITGPNGQDTVFAGAMMDDAHVEFLTALSAFLPTPEAPVETCPHGAIIADGAWCTECRRLEDAKPEPSPDMPLEDWLRAVAAQGVSPKLREIVEFYRKNYIDTESAKPERESLVEAFKGRLPCGADHWVYDHDADPTSREAFLWLLRKLDERGV